MATGMPYGLQAMLKDGHKHMQGVDEAVLKNIDAARGLAAIARTSLGPNGSSLVTRVMLFCDHRVAPVLLFSQFINALKKKDE